MIKALPGDQQIKQKFLWGPGAPPSGGEVEIRIPFDIYSQNVKET